MQSKDVRQSFLDYFNKNGHQIIPSASLIPAADPTLLFTNAGMNQFKDIFLGHRETITFRRVANSQKCIRVAGKHNDLEDVGKDTYHHTFFEMLGNWSFGDYYKEEAIRLAWELFTKEWDLPRERLWPTIFREDDEAARLWAKVTGIPSSRVVRFDERENFWEMGDTGPCGPCSEILMLRDEHSSDGNLNPVDNPDAFIELWNLVFIQFNRSADGSLAELPEKHIDTGMGFERITAVLQKRKSNYDTDLFSPLFTLTEEITGEEYGGGFTGTDVAFRVIADHIRALAFAIGDGVIPSNEGRGYVIRRILRRAVKYGRNLEVFEPFLFRLVSPLSDIMGNAYPELVEKNEYITKMIKSEEESFGQTIDRGIEIFEDAAIELIESGKNIFPGIVAFKLHDTYGFPLDLTELLAAEKGLSVDRNAFDAEMALQKKRSRQDRGATVYDEVRSSKGPKKKTVFDYKSVELESKILKLTSDEGEPLETAPTGSRIRLHLAKTPFYGESGGQVGDQGTITLSSGNGAIIVSDTQKPSPGETVHIGEVVAGKIMLGAKVKASIDYNRRLAVMRNHTATHLLHRALREILGNHVNQAGSLVAPDYLRFDFNHYQKVTPEELVRVEEIVNKKIMDDLSVSAKQKVPFQQAIAEGAMALFGEKYGETVRMITVEGFSKELCGGTHVEKTGQIGFFKIVSESSVAAGIRRIEAITGEYALRWAVRGQNIIEEAKTILNVQEMDVIERLNQLVLERRTLEKELKNLKAKAALPEFQDAITRGEKIDGEVLFCSSLLPVNDSDELMKYGDMFRKEIKSGIGVFGIRQDGKVIIMTVVTDDLVSRKRLHAGMIVKEIAAIVGGGGGGKPHMATAGGKDVERLPDALKEARAIVLRHYEKNKDSNS